MSADGTTLLSQPRGRRTPQAFAPRLHCEVRERDLGRRLSAVFGGLAFDDGERRLAGDVVLDGGAYQWPEVWLWFETEAGPIGAAALRLDGGSCAWPPSLDAASATCALTAMARLEFAIRTLEAQVPDWRPARLGPRDGRRLGLDLVEDDGRALHRLALCIPDQVLDRLPLVAARASALTRLAASLPQVVTLILDGPRVELQELETLAPGDLVWIRAQSDARLHLEMGKHASGRFDPVRRVFHAVTPLCAPTVEDLSQGRRTMIVETSPASDGPDSGLEPIAALLIQLHFEIGPWPLPLGEIARLGPGAILSLPDDAPDLTVQVKVGDRTIAQGRLVGLGRGHGVLVDRLER